MSHRSGCMQCGAELVYLPQIETLACAQCGKPAEANARCAQGHFICDSCHAVNSLDVIQQACLAATTTDPVGLALHLMKSPRVHMHGPEHHFLVPAVLIAAWCNARGKPEEREALLREARLRAEAVKGGFCGFWGACGAAVGTGIFASVVTGATPLSKAEWKLSNALTARVLGAIAENGGPRCCKRNTFLALQGAVAVTREQLGVTLTEHGEVRCHYHPLNQECLGQECRFHGGPRVAR